VLLYIAVTLLLTSVIKTFFVGMYSIPSESMEPYAYKGDRVLVDKLSTWVGGDPARGQVIVFHDPHHWLDGEEGTTGSGNPVAAFLSTVGILPEQHDDLLIKRIIGVGGDTVECRAKTGPVYLNGKPLDESAYIQGGKNGYPCYNGVYKVVVPKDSLWVLGDNREHSGDSAWNYVNRGLDNGFVPRANVVGHVVGVVSWLRNAPPPQPIVPPSPPATYPDPAPADTVAHD
jgi:signal peptidase I